jgi:hypothetical protein
MLKISVLGALLCLGSVGFAEVQVPRPQCLHERNETAPERARRQRGIQFAQLLNRSEAFAGGPGVRRYRPLNELANIPATPDGFRLQFHTDGKTYAFSLKDERDACGYSIFSDQESLIYEAMPSRIGGVLPATEPQP